MIYIGSCDLHYSVFYGMLMEMLLYHAIFVKPLKVWNGVI